jgi:O-glycosyl hydrolase/fibronectin type 3 domain-containing protein
MNAAIQQLPPRRATGMSAMRIRTQASEHSACVCRDFKLNTIAFSEERMLKKIKLILLLSAVTATTPGEVHRLNAQTVTVVETTGTQSELLAKQPTVSFGTATGGTSTITITPSVTYQQMDGFGAAMTDSSAYNIYNYLTPAQQTSLMQSLFSSSSGIGLTMLRQPMGASDFSAQGNFSYDDMPSGQTDVNLTNFSISKDLTYTIPVLKQAFAVNPSIKVELLPWSPPAWMKASGTMNGGNFNDTYMPSLAQYFVKAIEAYQGQGIPVYAISPQNEPENSNGSYPTETFSATEEENFIANNLGPALSSAGLGTKIFGYEHNWGDTTYPETLLADSSAAQYIAGISWHCYSGSPSAQSTVQAAYPSYGAWFTECSGETSGSFSGDYGWGMENLIIGTTRNWAKGVMEWNIALNQNSGPTNGGCTNCYGFVTINTGASPATVTPTTSYYTYGQANGVVPGAYRIETNSAAIGAGGIEDVAFQNPNGSIVLIVYNDGTSPATFDINWAPNNTNLVYTLPASSGATFYWTPSTGSAPTAPTNLAATTASSSQINLSWTASTTSGVTYSVFRSTTSGFTPGSGNQVTSGLTGTTYSNTGLLSGTAYYYLVEAVDSNGSSVPSNQATAATTAVIPAAPTNLTATTASSSQINLSWTATTTPGTITYSVYRSTTSGFTAGSGNLVTSGVSGTTYSNTGLTGSTAYYFLVEAVNTAGSSPASNQATATTTAPAPAAPTNLTATTASSSQINLSWTASTTSSVTYSVFRSTTSGFTPGSGNQITSGLSGTTYSNTGLSSGTAYYYVVEAVNSAGSSAPSNQATATTTAVAPTAPTGLTATAVSSGQINLSWTASTGSGTITYSIYRSTTSGFTPGSGNLVTSGVSGTTYSNTGLSASTTYYYVAEGVNTAGSSPASNQASATTGAASTISTTSYYTIANEASGSCVDDTGGGTSNGTVLQQWACSGGVNQEWLFTSVGSGYYEVTTYNSSTAAWNVVNQGTSPGTNMQLWAYGGGLNEQFEPVKLSSGYYEFIDHNSGLCLNVPNGSNTNGLQLQINTCNASTSESFTLTQVGSGLPAAPTSLTATAASSSQINLSWTASTTSGVTYSVYRSTTSGFTPGSGNLVTSGITTTTYSNTGLTASTTYYYVVEAVDSVGSSPASNQANATTAASGGGGISTTAYYQIVNEASGMCIDDTGGSTSNGTQLQQYTCYSGNLNQEWLFTATSGGYYEVTTYNSSAAAWNVVNQGTSPGTAMQLWAYGGGLNEQFEPVKLSTGFYEFIDRNSGLCLNVPGGAATNNLQLQINTCNGSTSESFTLNEL